MVDSHEEFLTRLRDPNVGRVGAREMLREVLRRLPGAWDPRVLDAARDLVRRFPELGAEFALLEQWAKIPVTAVMERALGPEADLLAAIAKAERPEADKLLRDLRVERGRGKDERARIHFALGRRLLELRDRKAARGILREAAKLAPAALRQEIEAVLDDLPGAKGREWRAASGTVAVSANPSEPAALRVSGRDAPPRVFVEERLLGAPLLARVGAAGEGVSIGVTLEHDTERVRTGSVKPREVPTAPIVGLVARDRRGAPIGIACGPLVSPIERFPDVAISPDATHVSIRAGATFRETRFEPAGAPNEGDGWLVTRAGKPFVRTRGGAWLRCQDRGPLPPSDARVRFRVTRAGLVWVAVDVKSVDS